MADRFAELHTLLDGRTDKVYRGGSARAVPPSETWTRIEPLLAPCGITRVANVTGLDHVGIPVYQAIRPNARSLSVSQGKGAEPIAAKVSATMEALELHFAERPRCALRRATVSEIARDGAFADPLELPHTTSYDARRPILWTKGVDIVARCETWVPYDLVHIDLTEPAGALLVTSNGLASGNNLAEAVFHGLCEVIERDAATLFSLRPDAMRSSLFDVDRVDDAVVRALLERLRAADLKPIAWNMTSDIGLPVICAYLFDQQADAALNPISAPYGAGCHIDGATALIRALTESAQTRVGWIAGSRDDLSRDKYKATQAETLHLAEYVNAPCPARLEDLPVASTPTVEEDIAHTIRALQRASLGRVIVVPIHDDAMPVAIAKVIVPGLEAPRHPDAALGKRARAVVQ